MLELHYLEIARYRKTQLERWLYILRQGTHYQGVSATCNALCDDEVRYAIEARRKWELDRNTEMNAALEAAEAQGEAEAARRIARQLLDLGQSEEMVFLATGLKRSDLE